MWKSPLVAFVLIFTLGGCVSARKPTRASLSLPPISLEAVSPDGREAILLTREDEGTRLWRLRGPGSTPEPLTSEKAQFSVIDLVPPDAKTLVIRKLSGGLFALTDGSLRKIFDEAKTTVDGAWIANDGEGLYFTAVRNDETSFFFCELSQCKPELLFKKPGSYALVDVEGDAEFLFARSVAGEPRDFQVWSTSDKEPRLLLDSSGEVRQVGFSSATDTYFVIKEIAAGERNLLRYSARENHFTPYFAEPMAGLMSFVTDHIRTRLYVQRKIDGRLSVEAFDARTGRRATLPPLPPDQQIRIGRTSRFGRFLTVTLESKTEPPAAIVIDRKEMTATRWFTGKLDGSRGLP